MEFVKQYIAKANNKYMNNYDKSIISSFLTYLDANNLYGSKMIQKPPVNGFKWSKNLLKFNEIFIENYEGNSDRGYFLEVEGEYLKNLFSSHKDLPCLPEIKKIRKSQKACLWYRRQKEICYPHKSFKTNPKSQINILKSAQSNSI